ncbi:MAG: leucine-rich repeat domain-containing protein, partial [Kordiimonadaceae bacterium]|nr:leucine-rich repeat domain-containing protein [Kordiimonadaceae bacterium]
YNLNKNFRELNYYVKLSELLNQRSDYQELDSIPGAFLLTANGIKTLCIGQDPQDPQDPQGWVRIKEYIKSNPITNVMILPGVTSIGSWVFYGCTCLTTINIPSSVTSIGDWAFCGCTSLTTINIPSSVTSIGANAFYGCTLLETINIPSSVTSIGDWAFCDCTSLTTINIPSSVTSIGDWAFAGCTSLTTINIPSSVRSIGARAFCGCTSLTTINIPSSVTSIGARAFYFCTSLTTIFATAEQREMLLAAGVNAENIMVQTPETPSGLSMLPSSSSSSSNTLPIIQSRFEKAHNLSGVQGMLGDGLQESKGCAAENPGVGTLSGEDPSDNHATAILSMPVTAPSGVNVKCCVL